MDPNAQMRGASGPIGTMAPNAHVDAPPAAPMSASVLGGQSDSESPETINGRTGASQPSAATVGPVSRPAAQIGGIAPTPGPMSASVLGGQSDSESPETIAGQSGAFTPTAEHIKRFEAATKSKFGGVNNQGDMDSIQNMVRMGGATPNARMDSMNTFNRKQHMARRAAGTASPFAKRASLTPFACFDMQKEAGGLTSLVQKGVKAVGKKVTKWGKGAANEAAEAKNLAQKAQAHAQRAPGRATSNAKMMAQAQADSLAEDAAGLAGAGEGRLAAGAKLNGWAKSMNKIPDGARRAIDWGVPLVGGGAALYGSNRMGRSSGLDEGTSKGFDAGSAYGIQAALQNAPQDPGILGRIMNVFRGQGEQPSPALLHALLEQNKSEILGRLRQTL